MRRTHSLAAAAVAAGLVALGLTTAAPATAAPPGPAAAGSACAGAVARPGPTSANPDQDRYGPMVAPGGLFAAALQRHATWLTTLDCTATGRRHAVQPTSGPAASAGRQSNAMFSSNWSGYQVNQVAGYAQGGWTVPTVTRPVPGYSTIGYYSSTWAGIGGGFNAGNGALIQAGTTQDISSTGVTSYYAWYEIVGGTGDTRGEVRINNLAVHPGDFVGGAALWTGTGAQAGVCNFTINVCISPAVPSSAPGTTAEWITEAPSGSIGILPLANFGSVRFSNACWERTFVPGAPCATIAAGGPTAIILQQVVFGVVQTLSVPTALTPDGLGFTINYRAPVRPDPCPRC
ncbi:MAG TPA: G1 family glutamic endopeptidase [Mycobacteriales bacterium]|nr:G1 family glutamic endopeptidase [Mycobacteriales bacterium]